MDDSLKLKKESDKKHDKYQAASDVSEWLYIRFYQLREKFWDIPKISVK